MQTIVIDVHSICQSVCLSRSSTRLYCAKTAEQTKILFSVNIPGGPRTLCCGGDLLLNVDSLVSLEQLKLET